MLVRSPYGPTIENLADLFVRSDGYAAVLQDDRGTFLSGGNFDLWRGASVDANSTMTWITQQAWSNGDVFTCGLSADGINQAMAALAAPPMLKGQWFTWATVNGHHFAYDGGAYRQDIFDGYMSWMNIEVHGRGKQLIKEVRGQEAFGDWWRNLTACPQTGDDSRPLAHGCVYKNIKWPIVLTSGWWDIFLHTSVDAWTALRAASDPSVRDKHVHIIGPLGHCLLDMRTVRPTLAAAEAKGFMKSFHVARELFKGEVGPVRADLGRLNFYVMGDFANTAQGQWNYWTSMEDWPIFRNRTYFLHPGGALAPVPSWASNVSSWDLYLYDPKDPTPMAGGNNLPIPFFSKIAHCSSADQSKREARTDVLTFDSDPLEEDTAIVGHVTAKLFVSSTAKDTDFVMTLSDLSESASSLVRFGVRRMRWRDSEEKQSATLHAGKVYEAEIDLAYTAYVFPKGHRIRVAVSSAAYPYYSANSNTGLQDLLGDVEPVVAQNMVHFSQAHPSQLSLPVVALSDLPRSKAFGSTEPLSLVVV